MASRHPPPAEVEAVERVLVGIMRKRDSSRIWRPAHRPGGSKGESMTYSPKQIARLVNRDERTVRHHLRELYPRHERLKWSKWVISEEMLAVIRAHFAELDLRFGRA